MKQLKILMLFITLNFVVITPMTMSSCRVTLLPEKNAVVLVQVQEILSDAMSLYDRIITSNDKRYATYQDDYTALMKKLISLKTDDESRKKAGVFVQQDLKIQGVLEEYRKDHETKGVLKNTEAKVYKEYIKSFIRPRLVSELSL